MTSRPSLLHDQRGSGSVQKLVLIIALVLGAVGAIKTLSGAVHERSKCANREIQTLQSGGPCGEGEGEGRPGAVGEPPPPAPEAGESDGDNPEEFDAGKELLDLLAELVGLEDARKCVMEGDILACAMTLLNFTPGRIFGLIFKGITNIRRIANLVDKLNDQRRARRAAAEAREAEERARRQCKGDKCDGSPNAPCFVAGTLVHTEDGMVPIEEVEAGDRVWSRDDKTGEEDYREVVRTYVTPDQPLRAVTLESSDATETIEATPGHPFWVEGEGWVAAQDLRPGDDVVSSGGAWIRVVGNEETFQTTTVYNLEVDEFHTYFVGESAAWVHNKCKHICFGRSAVLQIPKDLPEHKCPLDGQRVDGPPIGGKTENEACLAAKHAFNDMMPRGCRPKHLKCMCTSK